MSIRQKLVFLGILFCTFIAFLPSLQNDFVNWDDYDYVVQNETIRELSWANLKQIFTGRITGNYHPFTTLSFALEFPFAQLNPYYYHLNNLILHVVNTGLVYIFIFLLCAKHPIAAITALLFGIHPMHVESVAWVTERKDVLFALFYLLAMIMYLKFLKSEERQKHYYGLMLLFFICSLFSKVSAVSLPLALITVDLYFKRWQPKVLISKFPLFILSFIFGVMALLRDYPPVEEISGLISSHTLGHRIFMIPYALCLYIGKLVWPIPLSAFYPLPPRLEGILPTEYYIAATFIMGWIILLLKAGQRDRNILFGSLFFIGTIFFNLPITSVGLGSVIVADRFVYLPSIGLFFMVSIWVYRVFDKYAFAKVALGTVIISLVLLTWQRCFVWRNSEILWSDVITKYPNAAEAYSNRGSYLIGMDNEAALEDINRAIALQPTFATAYYNKGNIFAELGQYRDALEQYTKAIEINPSYAAALNNCGNMHLLLREYPAAFDKYQRAITIKPNFIDPYSNRGMCFLLNNDLKNALVDFEHVLTLNPSHPTALEKKNEILKKLEISASR